MGDLFEKFPAPDDGPYARLDPGGKVCRQYHGSGGDPPSEEPPGGESAPDDDDDELVRRYRHWRETPSGQKAFPLFERFALEIGRRGQRFGFRLIAERVRYEVMMSLDPEDSEGFRVNDHYTPYIARDVIAVHPWLAGLVEFRRVRGDG